MNELKDIKEKLLSLVLSGKKEEAIRLLQDKYGVDRTEAQKLLGLAIKESVTPAKFFSTVLTNAPERMLGGKGCKHALFKYLAIIFGFIGLPPLLLAIGIYLYVDQKIGESELTIGTVVELRPYYDYGEPTDYTPIVSYEYNGKHYSIDAPVYYETPEFEVGEQVELFVNKENPSDVIINTFTQKWFMVMLTGAIGGFFTIVMVVFIFLSKAAIKK